MNSKSIVKIGMDSHRVYKTALNKLCLMLSSSSFITTDVPRASWTSFPFYCLHAILLYVNAKSHLHWYDLV